ncbi:hypothetical protein DFP83_10163 [Idiomarina fontislapidosi]|uniref:Uncharacterized protein n=1 Tax=Idiomarina fontislapidosi TaxID=263723 RepID=A0A432YAV1_9GAMM|nr:hypothetical protein [Idiomarina fontislapidosi]PYE35189.1 hypothetical protein DFP83_10163 [Idiomarina fontislapidosi]RUO58084.1 hypothetical protein CWE25_00330 [Idiomarina fontislapidosi]
MLNLKVLLVALNAIRWEISLVSGVVLLALAVSASHLPLVMFVALLVGVTGFTLAAYIFISLLLLRHKLIKHNLYQLFLAQSEHARGQEIAGFFKGY